jgi:hypothetical protein
MLLCVDLVQHACSQHSNCRYVMQSLPENALEDVFDCAASVLVTMRQEEPTASLAAHTVSLWPVMKSAQVKGLAAEGKKWRRAQVAAGQLPEVSQQSCSMAALQAFAPHEPQVQQAASSSGPDAASNNGASVSAPGNSADKPGPPQGTDAGGDAAEGAHSASNIGDINGGQLADAVRNMSVGEQGRQQGSRGARRRQRGRQRHVDTNEMD